MAITPTEAKEQAKLDPRAILELELRIDKILVDAVRMDRKEAWIACNSFPSPYARRTIIQIYRDKGWDVKEFSDQRDGDYIIIKEK